MDAAMIERRARITCRIYRKLFEAGENERLPIVFDEMDPQRGLGTPDHALVRDVLDKLERAGTVFRSDNSRPLVYTLDWTARSRMARQMPGVGSYADRLRADLAAYDRGEQVHAGAFIKTEAAIRTGYSEAEPL